MIHHGDCVEVMAGMPESSVDAIVCDPPYGLEFMGKEWDRLWGKPNDTFTHRPKGGTGPFAAPRPTYGTDSRTMQEWHQRWATEALRVAKPGAYLLAFGGTRTYHRLAVAIEDAGWIIRDCLVWAYAQGFPKSRALLKPAWEPIVMARKPGPLRELAIDECRIPSEPWVRSDGEAGAGFLTGKFMGSMGRGEPTLREGDRRSELGRWPANVILTDPIFDGDVEGVVGGGLAEGPGGPGRRAGYGSDGVTGWKDGGGQGPVYPGESGTYSRFFLIPKADRREREPLLTDLGIGVEQAGKLRYKLAAWAEDWNEPIMDAYDHAGSTSVEDDPLQRAAAGSTPATRRNHHPTVKPLDLMRHLVRLITPNGGTCLDPFLGSGTTAIAAEMEGFAWIGIEREAEYVAIAEARLLGVQKGLGLEVPAPTPRTPNTHPDLAKHQPKRRAPSENYSGKWTGTEDDAA